MTTISDLFVLEYGHSLELNSLELSSEAEAVNFVGRAARRNGVTEMVKPIDGLEPAAAGSVTVALGGQGGAGVAFLQPFPFYCGRDVMILKAKAEMTDQEKLWWATCITANRFRFGFGRQANKSLPTLALPSKIPSWVNAIKLDQFDGAKAPLSDCAPKSLKAKVWSDFRYDELFKIKKGQRLTKAEMSVGNTPFISATDTNNGVRQKINVAPTHHGNTITVSYDGSIGEAFYQPAPYFALDDINVLYPKFKLNRYIAMFLCAIIRQEKFRYNYGRKWHLDRMNETVMRLPVTATNEPDWKFIEGYIKSLPYSKSI